MRVMDLDLAADPSLGLGPIQMRRLGHTVVLVGPNGAGKSRLLSRLPNAVEAGRRAAVKGAGDRTSATVSGASPQGRCILLDLRPELLTASYAQQKLASQRPARQIVEHLRGTPDHVGTHVAEYIYALANAFLIGTHPAIAQGESWRGADQEWLSLTSLVDQLLGPRASLELGHPHPMLFGRDLLSVGLSDGQNVLLQIAAHLHVQGAALEGTVLLLDEADAHLHPAASLEVFRSLRNAVGETGQLWVATHSLHIAAEAPESVWFMENGTVRPASRDPKTVARGLVGDDESVRRIRAYLDEPEVLARLRFAAECLVAPQAIETRPGDPQTRQVARMLGELRGELGRPLRVLDWGAGTGRLYGELVELPLREGHALGQLVEYHAYEPDEAQRARIAARIDAAEGAGKGAARVLDKPSTARDQRGGWFDVVVLMNVLHEIPPLDWLRLLDGDGDLAALLAPDGWVVIVEDTEMPHGENAHAHGFLVLHTEHWRALFGVPSSDAEPNLAIDRDRDGRLQAHAVPRALLSRVTDATRKDALQKLAHRALGEMRELRRTASGEPSYAEGLRFERWVQSLANATSALSELGAKLRFE